MADTSKRYQYNEAQRDWIAALRSGKYNRTTGCLRRERGDDDYGFCCLGVGADVVIGLEGKQNASAGTLSFFPAVVDALRLRGDVGDLLVRETMKRGDVTYPIDALADMNDAGFSFEEIADYIEQNPKNVFVK